MDTRPRLISFGLHPSTGFPALLLLLFLIARPAFGQPVVIATIGDYGTVMPSDLAVANLVKSWNPDFIMTLGDNNYLGTNYDLAVGKFYHEFIYTYSGSSGEGASSNRFWPVLGNHDVGFPYATVGIQYYLDYFQLPGNERYYSYRAGPVEIFAIDSEVEPDGFSSGSVQGQWLRNQLG